MNKMKDRQRAKVLLLAKAILDIEIHKRRISNLIFPKGLPGSISELSFLNRKLITIKRVNWRVLKPDGRIDKRRYRRFVSKHRKSIKVRPPNEVTAQHIFKMPKDINNGR